MKWYNSMVSHSMFGNPWTWFIEPWNMVKVLGVPVLLVGSASTRDVRRIGFVVMILCLI